MRVVIHQPEYLPWINLFIKMSFCDIFIFLDNVQYIQRSYQNRNMIKTRDGKKWLTVPLKHGHQKQLIIEKAIDNEQEWPQQHCRLITESYKKAEFFDGIWQEIRDVYQIEWDSLSELNIELIKRVAKVLNIKTNFLNASEMYSSGTKDSLILSLCKEAEATEYITGIGSKNYLDEEIFDKEKIKISYIRPIAIRYPQMFDKIGFVADLSIVDYLFNCGANIKGYTEAMVT